MLDICLDSIDQVGETESKGVTLLIGGTTFVGDLIHPVAYYKAIQAQFLQNHKFAERSKRADLPKTNQDGVKEIFMKNVTIFWERRIKTIDEPIALGVDSIDVFIFGKLDFSPAKLEPAPARSDLLGIKIPL